MKALLISTVAVLALLTGAHVAGSDTGLPKEAQDRDRPAQAQEVGATRTAPVCARLYVNIRHLSLETYITLSTEIVHGTVRWQLASVLPSGLVVTDYGISIQECLKGSLTDEVVLRLYGGVVDQYQTIVDRAAHLALNSELVLFLCPGTEPTKRGILGLADGAYQVVVTPTGERVVSGLHASGVPLPVFAGDIGSIVRKERK